jgi:hypothetical protein
MAGLGEWDGCAGDKSKMIEWWERTMALQIPFGG